MPCPADILPIKMQKLLVFLILPSPNRFFLDITGSAISKEMNYLVWFMFLVKRDRDLSTTKRPVP